MKFQAQTAEEREAWIKVLNDGINRAKNKAFDEVNICVVLTLNHKCPSKLGLVMLEKQAKVARF